MFIPVGVGAGVERGETGAGAGVLVSLVLTLLPDCMFRGQGLWQRHLSTLQNAEVALETQQLLLILLSPPVITIKSLPSLLAPPVTHTTSTI